MHGFEWLIAFIKQQQHERQHWYIKINNHNKQFICQCTSLLQKWRWQPIRAVLIKPLYMNPVHYRFILLHELWSTMMLSQFRDIYVTLERRTIKMEGRIKRYRLLYLASIRFKWDCDFSNPVPYSFHYPPAIFPAAQETSRNNIALLRKQSVQFPHIFPVIILCALHFHSLSSLSTLYHLLLSVPLFFQSNFALFIPVTSSSSLLSVCV